MRSRSALLFAVSCAFLVAVSNCRSIDPSILPTAVIDSVRTNDAGTEVQVVWQGGGVKTVARSDFLPPVCDPRMNPPLPYPDELRDAGIFGALDIKCLVLSTGVLEGCTLITGVDERIDGPVVDAVRGWRCSPAKVRGVPLASAHLTQVSLGTRPVPAAAPIASGPLAPALTVVLPAPGRLPTPFPHLPKLKVPDSNPLTAEKAELGALLFADRRLSRNGSHSCASCHRPEAGFASSAITDAKAGGAMNNWNTPSLLNVGYQTVLGRQGTGKSLEDYELAHWKDQLGGEPDAVVASLNAQPALKALFIRAFPDSAGATTEAVQRSLASYLRTVTTGNSPWDRLLDGDKTAVSQDVQRGWTLFDKRCSACHRSPKFLDPQLHAVADSKGTEVKAPMLRGLATTGPYLADGSAKTLDEAAATHWLRIPKPGTKATKLPAKDAAAVKAFLDALNGEVTMMAPPKLP